MGALTAYLTAMGSMLVLAQGVADTMLTFQNGLAIAAMGGGLWVLVQGVCALAGLITENVDDGTLNTTKLEYATTAMKTLMILMTAMSVLSSKTKFSSGAAALAMAGAMNAVAVAAAALTLVPVDSLKKAAGVLGGLSAAMAALGYFGSAGWSEGAGIFLMADALMAVAGACLMMGKVDWGELKKAGASLVVLSAIGLVLSKFAGPVSFLNVSTGMLAMSASLLVLAPAIRLIGMVKPEAVSQSLWIFADTMMAMFAGGMLLTCIPELALGLSTLAGAFTKFGKGMLYLAGAGAIFGTLALFADPLCTAIINAAPDIEDALVAVVTLICNAINQSAEPIGEAFTTLCKVLIQTAIDLIGWASTNSKFSKRKDGLYIDPTFERNYAECKRVGLPVGVYYYTYATTKAMADAELAVLKTALAGKTFEMPVCVDVEDNKLVKLNKGSLTALVDYELRTLESWGVYALLYTGLNFSLTRLNMAKLKAYDVWVAAYRKSMKKPATSYKYGIWQYTDEARIPGVSTNADMSYAYKDYPAIIKRAGLSRVKGA